MDEITQAILQTKVVEEEIAPRYGNQIKQALGCHNTALKYCLLEPEFFLLGGFREDLTRTNDFLAVQKSKILELSSVNIYKKVEPIINTIVFGIFLQRLEETMQYKPKFALSRRVVARVLTGAVVNTLKILDAPIKNNFFNTTEFDAYSDVLEKNNCDETIESLSPTLYEIMQLRDRLLEDNANSTEYQLMNFRLRGSEDIRTAVEIYQQKMEELRKERDKLDSEEYQIFLESAERVFEGDAIYGMAFAQVLERIKSNSSAYRLWSHASHYEDDIARRFEKIKDLKTRERELEDASAAIKIDPQVLTALAKESSSDEPDVNYGIDRLKRLVNPDYRNNYLLCISCGLPMTYEDAIWVTNNQISPVKDTAVPSCEQCVDSYQERIKSGKPFEDFMKIGDRNFERLVQKRTPERYQSLVNERTALKRKLDIHNRRVSKLGTRKLIAYRTIHSRPIGQLKKVIDLETGPIPFDC
jgi:hypothetical protein